jgi:hypothetical protein
MAKPPKETEESKPRSAADTWRYAERKAVKLRTEADAAEEEANKLGSELAESLLKEHGGAGIMLDGQRYTPKKSARKTRKDGSGNTVTKEPRFPFLLVRQSDRGTADL